MKKKSKIFRWSVVYQKSVCSVKKVGKRRVKGLSIVENKMVSKLIATYIFHLYTYSFLL